MKILSNRFWIIAFALMLLFIVAVTIGADMRIIPTRVRGIPFFDKLGHFFLYGILAFLLHLALQPHAWRIARIAVPLAVFIVGFLCIVDETQQFFVGTRAADLSDFAADMAGIIVFVSLAEIYARVARLPNRLTPATSEHPQMRNDSRAARTHTRT